MTSIDRAKLFLVAKEFDADFYRSTYEDIGRANIDPLEHYMEHGWREGRDPNINFSTIFYMTQYEALLKDGQNPLLHYLREGKSQGLSTKPDYADDEDYALARLHFNEAYYLYVNPDVRYSKIEPLDHYMKHGWIEGRNPSPEFHTFFYLEAYRDVAESGMNPLLHFARVGVHHGRITRTSRPKINVAPGIEAFSQSEISARAQDLAFPSHLESATKLIVIVVPEHNAMSGGIFSMFSIAKQLALTKMFHGFEVVVMTNPNKHNATYCRQKNFRNSLDVYRFEQLSYCREVNELYILIPEYASDGFLDRCSPLVVRYLMSRKKLFVNLLNQNINLMPQQERFLDLRRISDCITQSVAHHAYFTQDIANKYDLPTLLLPAYTDLSDYHPTKFNQKDKLIIYSCDKMEIKDECIYRLKEAFPNFKFVEIYGITFEHYMDLATKCMFSISFGEGYDGYIAQPIHQGGIGFAIYNREFFPSSDYLKFPNIFPSAEDMLNNIHSVMDHLMNEPAEYEKLNHELNIEHDKLYSFADYLESIKKLILRQFDLIPSADGSYKNLNT